MPKAQVNLTKKEFEEMSFFRFKKNWTVQRLLRRSLLFYIRANPSDLMEESVTSKQLTKGESND